MPAIKCGGERILFVHIYPPCTATSYRMAEQFAPQALPLPDGRHEKHFDLVGFESGESGKRAVRIPYDKKFCRRKRLLTHERPVKADLFLGEETVCSPYGCFPEARQGIQIRFSWIVEVFYHLKEG